jgi:small-conductance mechanosensitive channel
MDAIPTSVTIPIAILLGAFVLTRVVIWLVGRFERDYVESDRDEAARITRLQRATDVSGERVVDLRQKRALTMSTLLRTVTIAVIWVVAIIAALEAAGLPVTPFLAAAGIGGIALGFGAQSLVKDLISGFFILLERQFDIGDTVGIADVSGTVERIDLRSTVLRDIDGRRYVVPNGEIRVSTNYTHLFSRHVLTLHVPYEEDVDRAVEVARRAAEEVRRGPLGNVVTEPLNVLGIDAFGESSVEVKLYLETVPGRQWEVGREFRRALKRALDEAGIAIPYPHREVIVHHADGAGAPGRDRAA